MSARLQLPLPLPGLPGNAAGLCGIIAAEPEPAEQLWIRGEADELRLATPNEVIAAARRAMRRRIHRGVAMDSPRAVREFRWPSFEQFNWVRWSTSSSWCCCSIIGIDSSTTWSCSEARSMGRACTRGRW